MATGHRVRQKGLADTYIYINIPLSKLVSENTDMPTHFFCVIQYCRHTMQMYRLAPPEAHYPSSPCISRSEVLDIKKRWYGHQYHGPVNPRRLAS